MAAMVTADQLWDLDEDYRYDLIDGELIASPFLTGEQGAIGGNVIGFVGMFVLEHRLGTGFAGGTDFHLRRDPDTVLAPNGAFVSAGRFGSEGTPDGFVPFAPDWVVEIAEWLPGPTAFARKIPIYLASGVRLLWVIYPATQTVTVYTQDQPPRVLGLDDMLDGEDVLPGFTLPVRALFRD
jgi:Uma2 family endonuclease